MSGTAVKTTPAERLAQAREAKAQREAEMKRLIEENESLKAQLAGQAPLPPARVAAQFSPVNQEMANGKWPQHERAAREMGVDPEPGMFYCLVEETPGAPRVMPAYAREGYVKDREFDGGMFLMKIPIERRNANIARDMAKDSAQRGAIKALAKASKEAIAKGMDGVDNTLIGMDSSITGVRQSETSITMAMGG